MTDRPYGDEAGDDEAGDEIVTGDSLDAMFEVETSGEALPGDFGDDDAAPLVDDAEFAVGPQQGEDLPPELRRLAGPDDDLPLELDPTDPGFTADDLMEMDDVGDEAAAAGTVPPPAEPVAGGGDDRSGVPTEEPGDSVPTADWLLGQRPPLPEPGDEGGIPAGYEYLFQEPAGEEGGAPEPAAPGPPPPPEEEPAAVADAGGPGGESGPGEPGGEADSFPADIDLPDWASDDTVTSTTEYADLAAELAERAATVAEPSAVSANIPGLDSGLVGLEDVVGETSPSDAPAAGPPDLALRILTGVGLIALFALALLWQVLLGVLATAVFLAAAGELYAVLRANGYRPAAFIGLPGVLGAIVGTWLWGLGAVPVALLVTLVALALRMAMTGPPRAAAPAADPRQGPLPDAAVTVLGAVWIGGLGAFALPIIAATDYRWLIVAVVVIVVGLDVGQYFVGRRFGSRPLAPVVSPKKTVEGLVGGAVVAVAAAVALWLVSPLPLTPLVVLALAAVVLGPLGDLAVSVLKRILGVKDMGTILPGHGGILDRIDALLFVLPAAWLVLEVAELLT